MSEMVTPKDIHRSIKTSQKTFAGEGFTHTIINIAFVFQDQTQIPSSIYKIMKQDVRSNTLTADFDYVKEYGDQPGQDAGAADDSEQLTEKDKFRERLKGSAAASKGAEETWTE